MRSAGRNKTRPIRAKQPLQGGAYQRLAQALKRRADELELSVRGLAARLNKPATTVHKTLCGQRRIDPIEFVDWCEALEMADPLAVIAAAKRSQDRNADT